MKRINNYIIEKLSINKNTKISISLAKEKILVIMDNYLDDMIITKDEKYIINEIEEVIDTWINDNNIHDVNCYINDNTEKGEDRINKDKIKDNFDDISPKEYNIIYTKVMGGENVYHKRMKNQMVNISMISTKDMLAYSDSFLNNPIIFCKK